MVVVFRFAAGFDLAVDFADVDFLALLLRFAAGFFAPDLAPDAELFEFAVEPDEDTRDECFARVVVRFFVWRVCVFGWFGCVVCAASASPLNANATSATASILMVLRIIQFLREYDNAIRAGRLQ